MTELLVLFGGLMTLVVVLIVKLLVRSRRRTENLDGLEIERQHREGIRHIKAANHSASVHNRFFDGGRETHR
ncbi:hypothetical protein OG413_21025 [Streptomyces sp. NBC_01433]|uniref:hypothetical protein n=1 Tax=Streptomyces sp. NBC_01433 TaxID=2903864 RepID=UPI0022583EC5|nr:hypothetical protein [Streptomyces sp. NBC_01433]MCX4677760.1 hypothetical protein [Streptomyces sp. NBC_01433]